MNNTHAGFSGGETHCGLLLHLVCVFLNYKSNLQLFWIAPVISISSTLCFIFLYTLIFPASSSSSLFPTLSAALTLFLLSHSSFLVSLHLLHVSSPTYTFSLFFSPFTSFLSLSQILVNSLSPSVMVLISSSTPSLPPSLPPLTLAISVGTRRRQQRGR